MLAAAPFPWTDPATWPWMIYVWLALILSRVVSFSVALVQKQRERLVGLLLTGVYSQSR
jgi:hypothetical protein